MRSCLNFLENLCVEVRNGAVFEGPDQDGITALNAIGV